MFSRYLLFTVKAPRPYRYSLAFSVPCAAPARNSSALVFQRSRKHGTRWLGIVGSVGLGLAVSAFARPINCEPDTPSTTQSKDIPAKSDPLPPPPTSAVNLYELSFGTITGVCAGVFVKKGAKAIAFFLGGVFVLLQYFNSLSLVRIDWARATTKFENLFYTTEPNGVKRPPTVSSLWRWLVDFLTADFQQRASFLAGLALGLRIG